MITISPSLIISNATNGSSPAVDDALGILSAIGHPSTSTLAFLSLIFNSVVIAVLSHQRRVQQQSASTSGATSNQLGNQQRQRSPRHQAQIHLLFLAVSDLLVGLVFLGGAVWYWTLNGGSAENGTIGAESDTPSFISSPSSFLSS